MKKNEQSLREIWDIIKHIDIWITEARERDYLKK